MYSYLHRLFTALCVIVVSIGIVRVAASEPRPVFAGSYQLTQVVEDGPQVHFTVKFTLLNPGVTDIKGGILVIKDSQPDGGLIGKVATIATLPRLGQKRVSESFSISAEEFARWQQGHEPRFDFLVPAGKGAIDVPVQARPVSLPVVKTN